MTEITEEYNFDDWRKDNPDALKLFSIVKSGDIKFKTAETSLKPSDGTTLFYLVKKED